MIVRYAAYIELLGAPEFTTDERPGTSPCPFTLPGAAPPASPPPRRRLAVGLGVLAVTPQAQALTNVTTANGATVYINDARRPGLDTGSIRNVTGSRMEGFGNLFVHVDTARRRGAADERPDDARLRPHGRRARRPTARRGRCASATC